MSKNLITKTQTSFDSVTNIPIYTDNSQLSTQPKYRIKYSAS